MKKLFSILSLIIVLTVLIIACKDNFNEGDFLNLQAKLKRKNDSLARASTVAAQVAAMNTAGKLLAFTLQVVEDGKPLSGVAVLVTNDAGQSSVSNTATTDANGNAIFKGIPIGGNTITISKSGYMTAAMVVDFGTPRNGLDYILDPATQAIIPTGRNEAITAEMFANAANGSTAVIKGTVRIDSDLTNAVNVADALPSGLQIQANFDDAVSELGTSDRVNVNSYTFASGDVGVGTITNGAYSITVPASASGRSIKLVIPNITGTQHMALNGMNKVDFANGPAYQDVPTVWGPDFTYDATIPTVVGATAVFPAPPAVGAGLANAFSFPTAVPRSLNFVLQAIPNQTAQWTAGNITYQIDAGTGIFGSSPIVSLSGGGANTQATLLTSLRGLFTGFTGITAGSGYTGNMTLTFQYKDGNNNIIKIADFIVPSSGGGLPSSIDLTTFSLGAGNLFVYGGSTGNVGNAVKFDSFSYPGSPKDVSAFSVVVTGTGGTGASANPTYTSALSGIFASNSGSGYTSAPTISAFTGGTGNGYTPVAQPILKILDFGLQWNIAFDNTKITSPYSVIPSSIYFNTGNSKTYPISNELVPNSTNTTNVIDQNGVSSDLVSILAISGTTISYSQEPAGGALALHTNLFSAIPPSVVVKDITPVQAKATFAATDISTTTGSISSMSVSDGGTGYNNLFGVTIQPTITGAPGSGAAMALSGFSHSSTGAQIWNKTFTVLNQGSGYLPNLNQTSTPKTFGPSTLSFTVQTGQTYTVNIDYGTGFRQVPVK